MPTLTRRATLAILLTTIASAALGTMSPALAQLTPVKVALDWTPNTNHIGLYVAQAKGFFADAGIEVEILPYTDTASGTLVSNQLADFGIGGIGFYSQKAAGADLRAVYAVVQTETGRLVYNADRTDIKSPKDLDGKIYGGFGSAWEAALIGTIIRHDGGTGDIETVTLGTSAYEALANNSVDFTLEVSTWEGVKATLVGEKQNQFKYADYGVPDEHTTFLISSDEYLDANPETAKAFIGAAKLGYQFAVENPAEAADILIAANSDTLTDKPLIEASLKALIDGHYLRSADGVIGTIDPAKVEDLGAYLVANAILKDENGVPLTTAPDFTTYFSNDYLPQD